MARMLDLDDPDPSKAFLHSHTYSGNALGACLASETLKIRFPESQKHSLLNPETTMKRSKSVSQNMCFQISWKSDHRMKTARSVA